jgi:hypothetical protein
MQDLFLILSYLSASGYLFKFTLKIQGQFLFHANNNQSRSFELKECYNQNIIAVKCLNFIPLPALSLLALRIALIRKQTAIRYNFLTLRQ